MNRNSYRRKLIALFFLTIFGINTFAPATVMALTSGPKQPEMSGFQPAGVSDMVDVFSGDFKYNIPLLDVDGYPVNINYQSGVGMDDEASWVGLGWNLNVGSLNRQLRGLPDDFNGDEILTEQSVKPELTVGGRMNVKAEIAGSLSGLEGKINGTLSLGIFSNSYTGVGAEVGGNAGFSIGLSKNSSGTMGLGVNGGIGITSNTSSGVNVNPQISLSVRYKTQENATLNLGVSASLGYNTRGGYQTRQLGLSFSASDRKNETITSLDLGGSEYYYNTPPYYPKPNMEFNNFGATLNANIGGSYLVFFAGAGATGYVTAKAIKNKTVNKKGFGFLYAERGKSLPDALMDYKREMDNPVIPQIPNLALPVHMPDLYSFSSHTGGGQFRLYRGGTGVFFDDKSEEGTDNYTMGFDLGGGGYFHGGVTFHDVQSKSVSQKWKNNNSFNDKADFQNSSNDPNHDPVFFKQVGEKTLADEAIETAFNKEKPVAVKLSGSTAGNQLRYPGGASTITSSIVKSTKAKKKVAIGYLTAAEAAKGGLYKTIRNYPVNNFDNFNPSGSLLVLDNNSNTLPRVTANKKAYHISEFTVTNETGQRLVYGTPVYNNVHQEYMFNVGADAGDDDNLVNIPLNNNQIDVTGKGVDEYNFKQTQPAYATGYMLDAILSPDYVDVTGDGISDDDLGSYVKFNYSKLADPFKWRTPVDKANLNKSKLADADDNKGAITYGEKELWYLHSIETKTKVAFFLLQDRQDALGVLDWKGGKDENNKQKKLKEIRLFSKADYTKPLKTVVFNYKDASAELCQNVPNRIGAGGKLTLAGIQMIYGNDTRVIANTTSAGKVHEYKFNYGDNPGYEYMSTDRWGTYKPPPPAPQMKNDEFPYTTQNKADADTYASKWLLNQIELPTGGTIHVDYEADDYAYVQNKKAMIMKPATTLINGQGQAVAGLTGAKGIQITLDQPPPPGLTTTSQLKKWLLNGDDYIYGKIFTNISDKPGSTQDKFDFVSCYAKVASINVVGSAVNILWEDIIDNGRKQTVTANPFSIAAWQKMRMEYPQYAYPGYENRIRAGNDPGKALKAAANAFLSAFGNLREMKENFYKRCIRKGFGNDVNLQKSFFRITQASGFKMGGGVRVKKIKMNNNWATMSGSNENASYGMAYDYTTKDDDGSTISSGVASYEPYMGNDENPLRQPVPYLQSIKGALNNLWYLEQPFGEGYFPAPSVGYSKITVRNLDESGNPDPQNETGWTVSEFYTAREFPTIVKTTEMEKYENGPRSRSNLFGGYMTHELVLSQGYALYLNDMHGKPKSDYVYDQAGTALSGSEYYYHSKSIDNNQYELNNKVDVIFQNGQKHEKILGRDIELFTDMRESEFVTSGKNINIGIDVSITPWAPPIPPFLPIPHWPVRNNDEYRLFRSASVVKVVHQFGLIEKVIKKQNGSTIEAENIAYDAETGEVLVSKTHNEFKESIYSVNIPAYWVPEYDKMSGAYKTLGTYLKGFGTGANGSITSSSYNSFLQAGDELLSLKPGGGTTLMWVVETIANGQSTPVKRIVDKDGALIKNYNGTAKVIRSGYRNLFSMAAMSITSLKNPIENNQLTLTNTEMNTLRVLDSKATAYTENWDGLPNSNCKTCPQGYTLNPEGTFCISNSVQQSQTCVQNTVNFGLHAFSTDQNFASGGARLYYSFNPVNGTSTNYFSFGSSNPLWSNTSSNYLQYGAKSFSIDNSILNITIGSWAGVANNIVNTTVGGIKYFAVSSNTKVKIKINGNEVLQLDHPGTVNLNYVHIYPIELKQGNNFFQVLVQRQFATGQSKFGLAIIDDTEQAIISALNGDDLNNVSWTQCYNGKDQKMPVNYYETPTCSTCPQGYMFSTSDPDCIIGQCNSITQVTTNKVLNPYTKGFKGNWRPVQSQVFQTNRSYGNNASPNQQGINIAKDGIYNNYTPYWTYNAGNFTRATTNAEKWVAANTMTLYDQYGQELENKDALNRYSSAAFSFKGTTASLVASNAMHREVFYESFEDKNIRTAPNPNDCRPKPFSFDGYLTAMNSTKSHSGKYALQLSSNITINAKMYDASFLHNPLTNLFGHNYITTNASGEYEYLPQPGGKHNNGFEPMPGKRYVFSCWVKDGTAITATGLPANITFSGAGWVDGGIKIKARVEGWKLIEGVFETENTTTFTLNISGNASTWIDDLRIHPYNAQMKSYAYDERTLRLMAELDENNFAAFYEYDQEGILNRVKKETERGIMTIKETRSTYKKKLQ
jgi:hypothetical protein